MEQIKIQIKIEKSGRITFFKDEKLEVSLSGLYLIELLNLPKQVQFKWLNDDNDDLRGYLECGVFTSKNIDTDFSNFSNFKTVENLKNELTKLKKYCHEFYDSLIEYEGEIEF